MKAIVTDNCNGAGECEGTCPEVFELGDDGRARVKVNPVPKELQESCRKAKEGCPFQAIEIEE